MGTRYVIQATTDRCAANGCTEHPEPGRWRKSKYLPPGTPWWRARLALKAHRREFWKSGPFRLAKERY